MSQLTSVSSTAWNEAADEWSWLLSITQETSDDLMKCKGAIGTNWPDDVGKLAGNAVGQLYDQFNITSEVVASVVAILTALAESVGTAQTVLQDALYLASEASYTVDDTGNVTAGDAPFIDGKSLIDIQDMINEALRSADEADQQAAKDLAKLAALATQAGGAKESDVLGEQNSITKDAIAMYQDMVPPLGTRPDAVAAWWNSLTPGEQTVLENAVPLSLYHLDGIPDSIKAKLSGSGPVDRMALIQYAEDNYGNTDLDWSSLGDNCTIFASDALHAAGLPMSRDWNAYNNPFNILHGGEPDSLTSTSDWTIAQQFHNYLTSGPSNGADAPAGHEVPVSQARPGDMIFFKTDPNNTTERDGANTIFHTAIVTAVLPNGDVLYTQHSDGYENLSLDGRQEYLQQSYGPNHPVIVQFGS
ncbi:MAG TPA: amidase domain-containing protein [Pseudonocardiaceae bacterium]|nr:amidase domain-containing protein [Pseudonocardiaceae bacterium]